MPSTKILSVADPEPIGERGEDDRLVRGVPAVDVERGIGLGVAGGLRLGAAPPAKPMPDSVIRVRM